jgi:hypothetical protein
LSVPRGPGNRERDRHQRNPGDFRYLERCPNTFFRDKVRGLLDLGQR